MSWLINDIKRLRGTEPVDWRIWLGVLGCWAVFVIPLAVMLILQQFALPYHWVAG